MLAKSGTLSKIFRMKSHKQLDNYNNSDDEKVQLYHGDFRTESQNIADASIDLIFTDGPYLDSIELYKSMSEIGSRVLKDGGSLLCYLTQTELPAVLSAMSEYLHYYWIIALKHGGATGRHGRGLAGEIFRLQGDFKDPIILGNDSPKTRFKVFMA